MLDHYRQSEISQVTNFQRCCAVRNDRLSKRLRRWVDTDLLASQGHDPAALETHVRQTWNCCEYRCESLRCPKTHCETDFDEIFLVFFFYGHTSFWWIKFWIPPKFMVPGIDLAFLSMTSLGNLYLLANAQFLLVKLKLFAGEVHILSIFFRTTIPNILKT